MTIFIINPACSVDTLLSELSSRIDEAKAMTELLALSEHEWSSLSLIPYGVALDRKLEEISVLFKEISGES